jgi:glycosyltransferase involved in cell wall biosynthesis
MNTMLQPLLRQTITHFISFSRHLCRSVQGLGFQAISFMPLGIERRFQELRPQGLSGPPTILFVGALVPQKGVHVLIDAFVRIKRQIQNARLVIAGKGIMEPALRLKAESYEFSKDIKFLGFVDRANIPGLYRQAHVVAVPSLWKEQFGLVGPEALSSGVPCVGSKIGGIPEWLHDGKWGFLVPIADSSLLAERIALLLTNDELRVRFGNEGRQFVLREYGPERYERNLIACLNKYTVET